MACLQRMFDICNLYKLINDELSDRLSNQNWINEYDVKYYSI